MAGNVIEIIIRAKNEIADTIKAVKKQFDDLGGSIKDLNETGLQGPQERIAGLIDQLKGTSTEFKDVDETLKKLGEGFDPTVVEGQIRGLQDPLAQSVAQAQALQAQFEQIGSSGLGANSEESLRKLSEALKKAEADLQFLINTFDHLDKSSDQFDLVTKGVDVLSSSLKDAQALSENLASSLTQTAKTQVAGSPVHEGVKGLHQSLTETAASVGLLLKGLLQAKSQGSLGPEPAQSISHVGEVAESSGHGLLRFRESFGGIIATVPALVTGIHLAIEAFLALKAVQQAREFAQAAADAEVLSTTLNVVAANAGITGKQVDVMTEALVKFGATDNAAQRSLQSLIQTGLIGAEDIDKVRQLGEVAANAAATSGKTTSQALEIISESIQRVNERGLRRSLGLQLDMAAAMDRVSRETGIAKDAFGLEERQLALLTATLEAGTRQAGAAAAAQGTVARQVKTLAENEEEVRQQIGRGLLPAYRALVEQLNIFLHEIEDTTKAENEHAGAGQALGEVVRQLATALRIVLTDLLEHRKEIDLIIAAYAAWKVPSVVRAILEFFGAANAGAKALKASLIELQAAYAAYRAAGVAANEAVTASTIAATAATKDQVVALEKTLAEKALGVFSVLKGLATKVAGLLFSAITAFFTGFEIGQFLNEFAPVRAIGEFMVTRIMEGLDTLPDRILLVFLKARKVIEDQLPSFAAAENKGLQAFGVAPVEKNLSDTDKKIKVLEDRIAAANANVDAAESKAADAIQSASKGVVQADLDKLKQIEEAVKKSADVQKEISQAQAEVDRLKDAAVNDRAATLDLAVARRKLEVLEKSRDTINGEISKLKDGLRDAANIKLANEIILDPSVEQGKINTALRKLSQQIEQAKKTLGLDKIVLDVTTGVSVSEQFEASLRSTDTVIKTFTENQKHRFDEIPTRLSLSFNQVVESFKALAASAKSPEEIQIALSKMDDRIVQSSAVLKTLKENLNFKAEKATIDSLTQAMEGFKARSETIKTQLKLIQDVQAQTNKITRDFQQALQSSTTGTSSIELQTSGFRIFGEGVTEATTKLKTYADQTVELQRVVDQNTQEALRNARERFTTEVAIQNEAYQRKRALIFSEVDDNKRALSTVIAQEEERRASVAREIEQSQNANRSLEERTRILKDNQIAEETYAKEKERISKNIEIQEQLANQRLKALDQQDAQERQALLKPYYDAAIAAQQTYLDQYKQNLDKIKSLDKEINDDRLALDKAIRDARRQGLTDQQILADKELEFEQRNSDIKRALAKGDFELAKTLANQQLALAQELDKAQQGKPRGTIGVIGPTVDENGDPIQNLNREVSVRQQILDIAEKQRKVIEDTNKKNLEVITTLTTQINALTTTIVGLGNEQIKVAVDQNSLANALADTAKAFDGKEVMIKVKADLSDARTVIDHGFENPVNLSLDVNNESLQAVREKIKQGIGTISLSVTATPGSTPGGATGGLLSTAMGKFIRGFAQGGPVRQIAQAVRYMVPALAMGGAVLAGNAQALPAFAQGGPVAQAVEGLRTVTQVLAPTKEDQLAVEEKPIVRAVRAYATGGKVTAEPQDKKKQKGLAVQATTVFQQIAGNKQMPAFAVGGPVQQKTINPMVRLSAKLEDRRSIELDDHPQSVLLNLSSGPIRAYATGGQVERKKPEEETQAVTQAFSKARSSAGDLLTSALKTVRQLATGGEVDQEPQGALAQTLKVIEHRAQLIARPDDPEHPTFSGGGLSVFARAFQPGGNVTGPGTGTSDSILAWLSNGEYVIRAKAVEAYGVRMLDALNNIAVPKSRLPGFADGGLVGSEAQMGLHTLDLSIDRKKIAKVSGTRQDIKNLVHALETLKRGI